MAPRVRRLAARRPDLSMLGTEVEPTVLRSPPQHPHTLTPASRTALQELNDKARESGGLSPLAYNLTINHDRKFVWFRNAKVGTRTILGHFEREVADEEMLVLSHTQYPTIAFAEYLKFGFVRHPLDRFISAWQDKVHQRNHFFRQDPRRWEEMKRIESFAAWVSQQNLRDLSSTDRHLALQSRLVDVSNVDFLGRIESFDADFAQLCRLLGLEQREPARQNVSRGQGVTRDNASRELRSIVEEIYRLDYQVFGY